MAPSQRCIIMPCPVVIPVQAFLRVILLAIVLVRLSIACTCKYAAKRIVMVRFLYRAALVDYYPVIPLMVFQVIVILVVTQSYITLFGKKQLLDSVFIDHVSSIVRRRGGSTYLMDCSQLCAIGSINIGDSTSVTERYCIWQI